MTRRPLALGKLTIRKNTTLKGPHKGSIVIAANNVALDCGGHTVTGRGTGFGIHLSSRTGVTARNCDVTNFTDGINVGGGQRNTLTRNRLRANSHDGIVLTDLSTRNKITSNIAIDNGLGRGASFGFEIVDSHRNVLSDNQVTATGMSGGFSGPNGSSRNTYKNNTVTGGGGGFGLDRGRNTVIGNIVTGSHRAGIESSENSNHNVISDNTVTGVTNNNAFRLGGFGSTVAGNTANDNLGLGFDDYSVPGANTYVDNTCLRNRQGGSSPDGLCDDTVPIEPEVSPQPSDTSDSDGGPGAEE